MSGRALMIRSSYESISGKPISGGMPTRLRGSPGYRRIGRRSLEQSRDGRAE